MKDKKRYEKLLDGFMGLAYSFAAISAGISVFEHNSEAYTRACLGIIAIIIIANLYRED